MILFVNACARQGSRTKLLADAYISKQNDAVEEVRLFDMEFPKADEAFLKLRDSLILEEKFGDGMFDLARQFASADEIVIAAPFWDLSFPAVLKQYLEQVNVTGITFRYSPQGIPEGLCRAQKLTYITTAGGNYVPEEFGFGYVKAMAQGYYGIRDVRLIQAIGLDIDGADVEGIMRAAEESI